MTNSLQAPLPTSGNQLACRTVLGVLHMQQSGGPSHLWSASADFGGRSAAFKILSIAGCTGHALHVGASADTHLHPYSVPGWREGVFPSPSCLYSVCSFALACTCVFRRTPLQIASDLTMAQCWETHAHSTIRSSLLIDRVVLSKRLDVVKQDLK